MFNFYEHEDFLRKIIIRFKKIIYNNYKYKNIIFNYPNSDKPKILMVNYAFVTGGGELFPILLANKLYSLGFPIYFFNCQYQYPENPQIIKLLNSGIPIINYIDNKENINMVLERYKIDIIHSHHMATDMLFAKRKNKQIKQIVSLHGSYELASNYRLQYILYYIKYINLFTYISKKNLQPFEKNNFKISTNKFTKVANAIEPKITNSINRSQLNIPNEAFVLCLASRAIKEKGWQEAINITIKLNELKNNIFHLLLIGDGEYLRYLKTLELPSYIHLLGFKTNVIDYYNISDLGIFPSYYEGESFPLSLLECLFAKTPVIASDIGEIKNIIEYEDKISGEIIPLDNNTINIDLYIERILFMVNNIDYYNQLKENTLFCVKRFDLNNVINDYIKLYLEINNYKSL